MTPHWGIIIEGPIPLVGVTIGTLIPLVSTPELGGFIPYMPNEPKTLAIMNQGWKTI